MLEDLDASRRTLGSRHPDSLAAISNYAMLLMDHGRLDEAEALMREAVVTGRDVEPGHHPATMRSIHNLAGIVQRQGRFDEAEALYRVALAGRQASLGAAHADTRGTADGLEGLLRAKAAAAAPGARRGRA